jgi:hypothetical protein
MANFKTQRRTQTTFRPIQKAKKLMTKHKIIIIKKNQKAMADRHSQKKKKKKKKNTMADRQWAAAGT